MVLMECLLKSERGSSSDGSGPKIFDPGLVNFLKLGLGQPSLGMDLENFP